MRQFSSFETCQKALIPRVALISKALIRESILVQIYRVFVGTFQKCAYFASALISERAYFESPLYMYFNFLDSYLMRKNQAKLGSSFKFYQPRTFLLQKGHAAKI